MQAFYTLSSDRFNKVIFYYKKLGRLKSYAQISAVLKPFKQFGKSRGTFKNFRNKKKFHNSIDLLENYFFLSN